MNVIYSNEKLPEKLGQSIFLAGPTPRKASVKSWRPEALEILSNLIKKDKTDFTILVPEWKSGKAKVSYMDQVEWEYRGLNECSVIAMWIPRKFPDMPAMTTNIEFGMFIRYKKLLCGWPEDSEKNEYLAWAYNKYNPHRGAYVALEGLMEAAVDEMVMSNIFWKQDKETKLDIFKQNDSFICVRKKCDNCGGDVKLRIHHKLEIT